MRRTNSIKIDPEESKRENGYKPTYSEAQQQEYALEVHSLDSGRAATAGGPVPGVSELAETGANVVIEEPPHAPFSWNNVGNSIAYLPRKMRGGLDKRLPIPGVWDLAWSWAGAFLGILSVSVLNQWVSPEINLPFMVASLGASAVLVFALPESKLSQPRNFVGGQTIAALVGTVCRIILHVNWICMPLGMSLALLAMQLTSTTHPPAGATALIIAGMPTLPRWYGFSFVVTVMMGSTVMLLVALLVNNLNPRRNGYPTFWV